MSVDSKPGWTRYFCLRCRRALVNEPALKGQNPGDTVSPGSGNHWKHDSCGGSVALSSREVAA